ncbi:glycoside hydrolase family 2 TIM barrel-domain containing protein [Hymenobacter actinosclerus]|uniref:Glycosyl hydrolases family 2, TIM barrel domain n=1 Tax=Hymenobacter actinosclerus TaxID=82805 RepID=A0A1I0EC43_9BACT|nr:glycoside hydrolase family 2 TIM barrel-domain containing protein [Hymenobacter actinosclerus]SET42850.1 Glycosyl hydrolases family 2, TIM barrel domain [Hymenobacter actinosclerus]
MLLWIKLRVLLPLVLGLVNCGGSSSPPLLPPPPPGVLPVRIERTARGYELLRDGQPYYIRGVAGTQQLDRVRTLGGNSLRLYTTNYAGTLLDEAQRQGLTVMLGLWMTPEYEHFDYFDQEKVARQRAELREQVLRFRHHPALLMWNIGNELDLHITSPQTFKVLNEMVRMVHELDPYHPVTTTLSSNVGNTILVRRFCPDLDLLTINMFGQLSDIEESIKAAGWVKPYIVGEYGARGWWESPVTSWQAPIDQSSNAKAEFMRLRYEKGIRKQRRQCLGSYILYWGQRQEQTPMWFSLFTANGEKTAVVDVVHSLWTGRQVANRAPALADLRLAGLPARASTLLQPGRLYRASVRATDPEQDSLRLVWEVVPEVNEYITLPQHRTPPQALPSAVRPDGPQRALLRAPTQKGPYRLLVTAFDGHGSVATHSFPFYVGRPTAEERLDRRQAELSFKKRILQQ